LNEVISARVRPPIAPPSISGSMAGMLAGPLNWLQLYIAPTKTRISRNPVLLTVPLIVIASSPRETTAPLAASRKVFLLSTGLPLCMIFSYAMPTIAAVRRGLRTRPAPIRRCTRTRKLRDNATLPNVAEFR
jgi:hypothetical protein